MGGRSTRGHTLYFLAALAPLTPLSLRAQVHYANDLDTSQFGSGFPPRSVVPGDWSEAASGRADGHSLQDPAFYAKTGWNLNNLPFLRHSVTGHVEEPVQGVNVPWLYYGMLFASFAWHTEDDFLYSINYMHFGAPKSWYGCGCPQAAAFERAVRRNAPGSFRDTPDLLFAVRRRRRRCRCCIRDRSGCGRRRPPLHNSHTTPSPLQMVALHPPSALCGPDVDVSHCIQRPGEFVVTFPEGYHGGFSHGVRARHTHTQYIYTYTFTHSPLPPCRSSTATRRSTLA